MCGIAGYCFLTERTGSPSAALRPMLDAMRHRGPDDAGMHIEGRAGLGHVRLSILDLEGGRQPLSNEDDSVWVSFNGEIFNYLELRHALKARGHVFRTRSDTETIVHLYEERGLDCLDSFNGDFAFALWDSRRARLMLARDRMGVRPLYYTRAGDVLVFASEIKPLLQFPGVQARLDPIALDQCFTCWFPLAPRTAFEGIFELPPGHVLVAEGGRIRVRPYWQPRYPSVTQNRDDRRTEHSLAEELEALLLDATRLRLRADVPVGAYLSGGLDSSVTTALMRRVGADRPRSFSLGFESEEFDETPFQQQMVEALGTEHSALTCTRSAIADAFPDVVRHAERPILRTAPAPLYLLARRVRQAGIKVVMTGEGADEILGGYDIFKEAKVRRFWARQPNSAWRPLLLGRLYPYLPRLQGQPQPWLKAFFGADLHATDDPLFSHLPRFALTRRIRQFYSAEMRASLGRYDAAEELRRSLPIEFRTWHPLSQAQYLETAHLLPGYILSSQGDRMAMAHGVEGRFPFLDHRLVEFAARIPPRMKLNGLREKYLLRRALGRYLPAGIAARPKQPYRAPESESFFGADAPAYVHELLSPEAIRRAGYFAPGPVEKLLKKCRAGAGLGIGDNMALVGILSTQLLDHQFIRGRPVRLTHPSPAEWA
jgi:asparagine synthase (glutamine-hydrolysing)